MACFTVYSLISDVSGTVRQCNLKQHDVNMCKTENLAMDAGKGRTIESPSGKNKLCSCVEDLCNSFTTWREWDQPTTRRPTTRTPTTRKQAVGATLLPLPTDSEGVPLPTDSEGVPLIQKSMSTKNMEDHVPPVTYNDNSTDKIQSNGVKALNNDVVFATILTLLFYVFW